MTRFDIDEATYGHWAAEFRRLLGIADDIKFPRSEAADEGAEGLAELLVELLGEPLEVQIESGGWRECDAWMKKVEPWADGLTRIIEAQTESTFLDPALRSRIVPPLWPVTGMLSVVEVLVADTDRVLADVPPAFREVAWRLACTVEKSAWGSLRWSMSCSRERNPFEVALLLAAKGIFTLGRRGEVLILFMFSTQPGERVGQLDGPAS